MRNFRLDRRTVLRGLVGGALTTMALPRLDAMFNGNGDAMADGTQIPRRLGIFFWGNGVKHDRWNPATEGPGWELTTSLMPLAALKKYVSVITGTEVKIGGRRGHHDGCGALLSGVPFIPQDPGGAGYASTFGGPSIDQVAAAVLGAETRFRSLEFGVSRRVTTGEGTTLRYLSHNGPDNANPPEYSPRALFDRVFGDGFVAPGGDPQEGPDPRLALRRSVLDAVLLDAADLRSRLGSRDRLRLEQHFDSIRGLEARLALLEDAPPPPPSCQTPARPDELIEVDGREQLRAVNAAMSDVIALALACDQTRVFSNMFSGSVGGQSFPEAGTSGGHHSLTHDEPGDQPQVGTITTFIIEQLAAMLAALEGVPEGAGNLLDRCVVLATTDLSDGRSHNNDDYPILVAGGGGGSLKTPGVHYRSNRENTSQVLMTVLRAVGLDLNEFGAGAGRVTSGISAIEA